MDERAADLQQVRLGIANVPRFIKSRPPYLSYGDSRRPLAVDGSLDLPIAWSPYTLAGLSFGCFEALSR